MVAFDGPTDMSLVPQQWTTSGLLSGICSGRGMCSSSTLVGELISKKK